MGCIAYISKDGYGVCCRHLFCRPTNGQWALSDEILINGVSAVHGGTSLLHLSWNHAGNELAIFDALGKVSIITIAMTLNDFSVPRKCVIDVEDQLHETVGLLWLHADKPVSQWYELTP